MSETAALSIKLIRECILSNITELKDLFAVSLINRDWYVEVRKRLESRAVPIGMTINQQLLEYTKKIREPIICGRYMNVTWATDGKLGGINKFTKALRAKVVKRLPLMEPRIFMLLLSMGESMTADELVALLKNSRNAKYIVWSIEDCENKEKLSNLLEEVKLSLDAENLSFHHCKKLDLFGSSEVEWKFWADEFISYFPNLENLKIFNSDRDYDINEFLGRIDNLGKLQTIKDFSCSDSLSEETWNRLLEKSYSFKNLELEISNQNIPSLDLFLEKYQHQIEKLHLNLKPGFYELHIPPMSKLTKLELHWHQWQQSLDTEQVLIDEDEDAYPKLREIKLGGFYRDHLMVGFRNIAVNTGVSTKIQKVTAYYQMNDNEFLEWMKSGGEVEILEELNQLFPNAKNEMYYEQMNDPDYPNIKSYAGRNMRRCVIS